MGAWLVTLLVSVSTVGAAAAWPRDAPDRLRAAGPSRQNAAPAAGPRDYLFPTGAGLLFFYVRADRASDFEAVIGRLAGALAESEVADHRAQAAGWRVFRSVEDHPNRVYVFVLEPALPDTDYDPVRLLSVLLPDEVGGLYGRLKDAVLRVERMGLARTR